MDVTAAATLFAWMDREIWLVTAQTVGKRGGLIATSVNQASIAPDLPRVSVTIARHHHTWELIEASGVFALHLLAVDNLDLVWRFRAIAVRCVNPNGPSRAVPADSFG